MSLAFQEQFKDTYGHSIRPNNIEELGEEE